MYRKIHQARISLFLFLIIITTQFFSPALKLPVYASGTARIHYLTLPDSMEAILLECNGQFGMVDSGEDNDYPDGSDPAYPLRPGIVKGNGYEDMVIDYLRSVGVTQDNFEFYIGTHPHSDHIGSADEIIRSFHPKRVYIQEYQDSYISYETNLWDNLYVYDQMLTAAAEVNATIIQDFAPGAPLYPEKVSVKGTVIWDDQDDSDHLRPQEVTVTLLDPAANNEQTFFVSPDEEGNWTYQFDHLQKYDDDKVPVMYEVMLSDLEGYEVTKLDSGYDFLCFHTPSAPEVPEEPEIPEKEDPEEPANQENPAFQEEAETLEEPGNQEDPTFLEEAESPEQPDNQEQPTLPEKAETPEKTSFPEETEDLDSSEISETRGGHVLFSEGGVFDAPFESNDDPDEKTDHMFTDAIPLQDQVDPTCLLDPNNIDHSDITEPVAEAQKGIFHDLKEIQDTTSTPNFTLGNDMEIQIKHYGGDYQTNPKPDANYFSLGVLVKCNGISAFLAGDINNYEGAETALADELGHVDILTLGHHGYYGSNTGGYLTALSPSVMVCAGGCYLIPNANEYDSMSTLFEMGTAGKVPLYPTAWYHDYVDALVFDFNEQLSSNIPSSVSWLAVTGSQDSHDYIHYLDGLPTPYTGWFDYSGKSYYFSNSYRIVRDEWVLLDNDIYYYFDHQGQLDKNWIRKNGQKYCVDQQGNIKTAWQFIDGAWYYMDSNGAMTTGWQKVNGNWYYLSSSGTMLTEWQEIDDHWYYLNPSGAMLTGWQKLGGNWYYLNPGGSMATGWHKINGYWYYMNKNGIMTTGWQKIDDHWYYMNSSGTMLTGWQMVSGRWYYLNPNGSMQTGWQRVNDTWYYLSSSGAMLTGWQMVNGNWYYMNSSGAMLTGWQKISGSWYYMNSSGAMLTGWQKISGNWYYMNSSGAMLTGWQKISGKYYYMYASGKMAADTYINSYYVNKSGVWIP